MNHDPENLNSRSAIVITIEGLGARWLEPWGCGSVRTPAFNRLAVNGLLVENAHAIHGDAIVQWNRWMQPTHGTGPDWLSRLADSGHTTILMTDSSKIAAASESHFQEVVELEPARPSTSAPDLDSTHFVSFLAAAAELAQTLPEEGTLLWIHSSGLRLPWDAPWEMRQSAKGDEDPDPPTKVDPPEISDEPDEPGSSDLFTGWQQAMAAQIHVLDSALALFLDSILDPDTCSNLPLVCLSSTGGYGMGEHSRIGPAQPGLFHDEYIHVPLLFHFPDSDINQFRLSELMSVDRLSGIVDGWMNGSPAEQTLSLSVFPDRTRQVIYNKSSAARMIRTPTWKLLQDRDDRQLFLKPDDRWDQNDVANLCRDVADQLSGLLDLLPETSGDKLATDQAPLAAGLFQRVD